MTYNSLGFWDAGGFEPQTVAFEDGGDDVRLAAVLAWERSNCKVSRL